jgi:excisionase family DNA binding protein
VTWRWTHRATATPWMVVTEAAAYARVSTKTIYRAVETGKLRHARVGDRRALRFRREYLDEFLENTVVPVEVTR